jgi:hypothetical protein
MNSLTGALPTELGTLTAMIELCVPPHSPRLDAWRRYRAVHKEIKR